MKKLLLTLGTTLSVVAPITAAISCGEQTKQTKIGLNDVIHPAVENSKVTVNVRIPDWSNASDYDDIIYNSNPSSFIRYWEGKNSIAKMVSFTTVHKFVEDYKPETLGDLLDEINARTNVKYFSWNLTREEIANGDKAALEMGVTQPGTESMGRFLTGVLKGTTNPTESDHNSYYGSIYEEQQKDGSWIQTTDPSYESPYISISSNTNPMSINKRHEMEDINETFLRFDYRLPKGCDNIHLAKNDIINLNLWKMVNMSF